MIRWRRAVEAINDLYRQELRWLLNLFLPSVKMVKENAGRIEAQARL
jgi:hypothetical protein